MRRPGLTAAQKQHAREQRALLGLRRAAVRYTNVIDANEPDELEGETFLELETAAFKYTNAIGKRERRRLS